jgi:hypothetical protein
MYSPLAVALSLVGTFGPWLRAWKAAAGTSLRAALIWTALAMALGLLAEALALNESVESGRPWAGRLTYVMVLAILAALISVLGARKPGAAAWAVLMVLLVVVLLIPWLEGAGRLRGGEGLAQLQLHSPWTLFYGLLVVAGVTNYLPTRYSPAAVCIGAGLVLEYLGLTRTNWPAPVRAAVWSGVAWTMCASVWLAAWSAGRPRRGRSKLERLWLWFRDHWGVVWALRTQERFNRTARLAHWPWELTWFGLSPAASFAQGKEPENLLDQAETTFRSLIRRFVVPERLDEFLQKPRSESKILPLTTAREMME